MTDRPRKFDGEDEQTADLAPENANAEQDDTSGQAQTLAGEAVGRGPGALGLSDTEKVGGDPDFADTPDLVDHMNQMVTSGRVDMSAYRGEPNFDEEDDRYGPAAEEDDPVTDEDQDYDPSEDEDGLPQADYAAQKLSLDEVGDDELASDEDDDFGLNGE